MSVHSGKDGTATWASSEISELSLWNFTDLSENQAYHTNATGAARKRVEGVHDSNGTFRVEDKPTAIAGAGAELVMYDNETIWTVTIIVDNVAKACDINGGTITGWDVTWSGNSTVEESSGSYSP